jgi:exonuclease III
MKGLIWNIRGLNQPGRKIGLEQAIREHHIDFVGVQETKKEEFISSFLKNLSCPVLFEWFYLPAIGTTGGILVGVREEKFKVSEVGILKYFVSCFLQDKKHVLIGGWLSYMACRMRKGKWSL